MIHGEKDQEKGKILGGEEGEDVEKDSSPPFSLLFRQSLQRGIPTNSIPTRYLFLNKVSRGFWHLIHPLVKLVLRNLLTLLRPLQLIIRLSPDISNRHF